MCGLPDTSVKESQERVRTAIKNSGYELLSRKIVVNLAPANLRKEGSIFDLPIAVGILKSLDIIYGKNINSILFIGELSLNGNLNPIHGALPICMEAKKMGIQKVILPKENVQEASIIEGIEILGAEDLNEVVNYLNGNATIQRFHSSWENLLTLFFRDPGLPINKQLCPPAAATSIALFTFSCPFTSEKSNGYLACVSKFSHEL